MLLGAPIAVAGAMLRRWSMATLGRHFTLRLSIRDTHKLITAAPYNIVRHPSYSGAFLASYGGLMVLCAPADSWMRSVWLPTLVSPDVPLVARALGGIPTLFYAVVLAYGTFVTFSRTSVEDRMMRDHFGKEWDKWSARVPYKMFPGIW
jgi:protein-S-isoprenylcysteine O-methyltransferase Ste14